jgi:hypothetical protein
MRYDAYVRVPLLVVPRTASGIGAPGGGGGGRKKLARGKDDGKRDGRGVWGGDHLDRTKRLLL